VDEARLVRTRVRRDPASGGYAFGSGYVVASGVVLTAAHVLERTKDQAASVGDVAEVLAWGSEDWQGAEVTWADSGFDVATLRCDLPAPVGDVRWGRLVGSEPLDWKATGFPLASLEDHARRAEQSFGRVGPLGQKLEGRLALTVESRSPLEGNDGTSLWAGISGAAIFSGEVLVGVVLADPERYGTSLEGRRAEAFIAVPGYLAALGHQPRSEEVSGGSREPGLADLWSTLPARNPTFTGRDEDLAALETRGGNDPLVVVGLGGVGKSSVALEHAHRRLASGAVELAWWFPAGNRGSLLARMAAYHRQVTGIEGTDAETAAVQMRNWLERCPYRWLVVLDDAEPGWIRDILPSADNGQVVLTSRQTGWPDGFGVRELGVLSPEDASALLATKSGQPDDEEAQALVEDLGRLALSVEQAGAFISKARWSPHRYREMLDQEPLRLHGEDLAKVDSTVALVFQQSLDHVTGGDDDHRAAIVLGVLAYLAADDIPGTLFDADVVANVPLFADLDPLDVDLGLAELEDYSLLHRSEEAISVHRLVQTLMRLHLANTGRHEACIGSAVLGLRGALRAGHQSGSFVSQLFPHVRAVTTFAAERGVAPESTVKILLGTVSALLDAGQLDSARPLLDRAKAICDRDLGPDHHDTFRCRLELAHWLNQSGQLDAATVELEGLLDDEIRVLGPDHQDTFATRGTLATVLAESGQVKEAIEESRKLLDDEIRVLGSDHPSTLITRNNVSIWLGRLGRTAEVVEEFQNLIDDQIRVLGPDNRETLRARGNLAIWVGHSGRMEEAVEQLRQVQSDQTRVLGPDHSDVLDTRRDLVNAIGKAGNRDQAVEESRGLLNDRTRLFGPNLPKTLRTRQVLARWTIENGQAEAALGDLRRLVDDQVRVLGSDHPDLLDTRGTLAAALGQAGHLDEAIEEFGRLLDDQARMLGPNHPTTYLTRLNLAVGVGRAGSLNGAVEELRHLLDDQVRTLGLDAPDIMETRGALAYWLVQSGDFTAASEEYRLLFTDQQKVLGADAHVTLTTHFNLAVTTAESGYVDAAIDESRLLLADQGRVLGPAHPDTVRTREALNFWMSKQLLS